MFLENHIENATTAFIKPILAMLIKDLNRKCLSPAGHTRPEIPDDHLFSCAMDATSAPKIHFQSDMVCTVKLTQSTQSPRGTRFSR